MAVEQLEYREMFPRLAIGQVWIANCPMTMIESTPVEFRGSSIFDPGCILRPCPEYLKRSLTWERVFIARHVAKKSTQKMRIKVGRKIVRNYFPTFFIFRFFQASIIIIQVVLFFKFEFKACFLNAFFDTIKCANKLIYSTSYSRSVRCNTYRSTYLYLWIIYSRT